MEETYGYRQAPAGRRLDAANSGNDNLRQPGVSAYHCAVPLAVGIAIASLQIQLAMADNSAEVVATPTVEVVGTTPRPGLGTPIRDVPANVQIFTSKADQRAIPRTRSSARGLGGSAVSVELAI